MISHAEMMKFSKKTTETSFQSISKALAPSMPGGLARPGSGVLAPEGGDMDRKVMGLGSVLSRSPDAKLKAYQTFAKLKRNKVAVEKNLKSDKLEAELVKMWSEMTDIQKRRFFSTFTVKVNNKIKKQETKTAKFVTPKIKANQNKTNPEFGSNGGFDKGEILKELHFFKNLGKRGDNSSIGNPNTIQSDNSAQATNEADVTKPGHEETFDPELITEKKPSNSIDKQSPKTDGNLFKCDVCSRSFSYMKHFNSHMLKGNCKFSPECPNCGIKFKNVKTLKNHIHNVHEKPIYKCAQCSRTFPTEKTIRKHIKYTHEPKECIYCEKVFKNSNSLRSHFSLCLVKNPKDKESCETETKKVNVDDKTPEKSDNAKVDDSSIQSVMPLKECRICSKTFMSKSGLNKHKKTHKMADIDNNLSMEYITVNESVLEVLKDMPEGTNFVISEDDNVNLELVAEEASAGTSGQP